MLIASNYNKTIQDLHSPCFGKREYVIILQFMKQIARLKYKTIEIRKMYTYKHIDVIAYLLLFAFDARSNLYLAGNLV